MGMIEELATKIMGWEKIECPLVRHTAGKFWVKHGVCWIDGNKFNPLEDYNDWNMVEKRIMEDYGRVKAYKTAIRAEVEGNLPHGEVCTVTNALMKSSLKEKCVAALKCYG